MTGLRGEGTNWEKRHVLSLITKGLTNEPFNSYVGESSKVGIDPQPSSVLFVIDVRQSCPLGVEGGAQKHLVSSGGIDVRERARQGHEI